MNERLQLLYPSLDASLVSAAIEHAEDFALDYCNIEEIPSKLLGTIEKMARAELNLLKTEGLAGESAGGSSATYREDPYGPDIYKHLRKCKRIKVM